MGVSWVIRLLLGLLWAASSRQDNEPPGKCHGKTQQEELNSFLWVIKKEPPSYFFGTIHVPYTKVWDFIPENSKEAFDRSERVYFELDLTNPNTISTLANCQMLPQGEYLSNVLPRDIYRRLKRHLEYVKLMMPVWMTADQRGRGLYADYLFNAITGDWERKRPVWVMLMVNSLTENDIKARGIPVLDLYLAQEAEYRQKHTGAVERVEEQCLPLNELNFSQVVFALNQTLKQHESYRLGTEDDFASYTTNELIEQYNCGDLNSVIFNHDTAQVPNLVNNSLPPEDMNIAKHIDDYFREELIMKRNARMAARVEHLLGNHPNQSFFFAFGAGHFLGNGTVLDLLRASGYDVQHVSSDEQVFLGENYKRRRRKGRRNPCLGDFSVSPIIFSGNPNCRRHRHNRCCQLRDRDRKGRKKDRPTMVTDSDHRKQPHFNDLWVRLEATSFGPNSYLAQQNLQIQQQSRPTTAYMPYTMQARTSTAALVQPYYCQLVAIIVTMIAIACR